VYLAIPAGVAIMMALHAAQQRHSPAVPQRHASRATIPRLALVFGFIVAAAWMFPGSGYRGMLALVGALAVLLPLVPALRRSSRAERLSGLGVGLMLSLLAWGVSWLLPKGPYVVYALGVSFAATALGLHQQADGRGLGRLALPLALGGYLWVLTGVALVAMHWGGTEALWQALPVIGALLLMAATLPSARLEAWPSELRWHGNTMAAVVAAGGLVAIFGGGAYLSERFSTASTDVGARLKHWQLSVSMLDDLDSLLLGQGLGRYVDSYALSAPEGIVPGDYRMGRDGDNQYVIMAAGGRLASGKSMRVSSFSDMLLLSQRTALPLGLPTVSMQVRASAPTVIYVAVCSKHLLYPAGCIGREVRVKADPGVWQSVQVQLAGKPLSAGSWYAPRLIAFVIGIDSSNRAVDIDNIDLTDTRGSRLLSNGDFSAELAHWFFTSDHSHLPWHAKNMAINVLFDQGMLGLALLTALLGAAFWRLGLGGARNHPLAPTLAGALTAYLVVGLFDSLLDVPRVTFVFYWLVLLSLTLGAAEGVPFRPKRASRRQR
jgi:hypothetical protein